MSKLEEEKQKVAILLKLNNELSEKLEAERDVSKSFARDVLDARDQRDAAVAVAKSLGEDLRVARANGRLFRLHQSLLKGLVNGLDAALGDIDVQELGNQLDQIAQMLEQQDNYADAKLLFNAASACEVVSELLDIVDNLRDREPDIYPTIEALD